ncbi:zymogen granule membrane protein 16-like [Clupea harengus]|uniref:Zymogen granule membrane protein 16-like n=1 Tax=Clupea harengus TaxID=7950 RepID=A0A6P8H5F6_CLUHA|nr:zymogen granule membrane protein 16-like [Clupea harengus]
MSTCVVKQLQMVKNAAARLTFNRRRMQVLLFLSVLLAAACAAPSYFSFSPAVGSGVGTSYTITGTGRITAVRTWENYNRQVRGIQLRYGFKWSPVGGNQGGRVNEIELFDDEFIVQISGKHVHWIYSLMIVTNRGRSLIAGQPVGLTFNMYPSHPMAELRFLSGGHQHGIISSIASHWAVLNMPTNGTAD